MAGYKAQQAPFIEGQVCPAEYVCPLTKKLMHHPVRGPDGRVYERSAIEAEIHDGHSWICSSQPGSSDTLLQHLQPLPEFEKEISCWAADHYIPLGGCSMPASEDSQTACPGTPNSKDHRSSSEALESRSSCQSRWPSHLQRTERISTHDHSISEPVASNCMGKPSSNVDGLDKSSQVVVRHMGPDGHCDSSSFCEEPWLQLELKPDAQTAAAGWQSDDQEGRLVMSSQRTVPSNHRFMFFSSQQISVSATVSLWAKQDRVAFRVHAFSAESVGSGKVTIARMACRASPFSFDPGDPANYGPLLHASFSPASDDQMPGAAEKATDPIVIASEGLSLTASFGSGQPGPSFQAAARAGATGINESSQRSQHGLIAAFCQRRCPTEKVQWVLRFAVDVRWSSSRSTPQILELKPFSFHER